MGSKHNHTWRGEAGNACVTPTYRSWQQMRDRCLNHTGRNFENYGGRGIVVCTRWSSFETFLADMGERPAGTTLDRLDVNGGYEPANCRWATFAEQSQNQRSTKLTADDVRWIRAQSGRTHTAVAEEIGVGRHMVSLIVRRKRWANV